MPCSKCKTDQSGQYTTYTKEVVGKPKQEITLCVSCRLSILEGMFSEEHWERIELLFNRLS